MDRFYDKNESDFKYEKILNIQHSRDNTILGIMKGHEDSMG